MIFPRLFTCQTTAVQYFRIDFEVNLVVEFLGSNSDGRGLTSQGGPFA